MSGEYTVSELRHTLERIEKKVDADDAKLDHLVVDVAMLNQYNARTDARLVAIEAWHTWVLRIVVGAVLLAALGLVIVQGAGQ